MNTYISDLMRRYKSKGLLIDANLAVLYVVGSLDQSEIRNHPRTSGYTEDDFRSISKFIDYFSLRVTTPHVLTEISDLLKNRSEFHEILRGYIQLSEEIYTHSVPLSQDSRFLKIGLADIAIVSAAKNKYLVLTDDGPLQEFLARDGVSFVSLDQIRTATSF